MVAVRSMLARVAKLEAGRDSPALAFFGTPEFEAQVRAKCAAGTLDARDWLGERGVLAALQRWSAEKVWLSWQR